jgi:hypothetical protein
LNTLARNDVIDTAISKAKVIADQFVGQKISWKTMCAVDEANVTLGNKFAADGMLTLVDDKDNPIAMLLLADRPGKLPSLKYDYDVRYAFFQLVPEQVSIAEAKLLTKDVIVRATVKEIEIARYRDRDLDKQKYEDEWYLMYVYLTDVKLEPAK